MLANTSCSPNVEHQSQVSIMISTFMNPNFHPLVSALTWRVSHVQRGKRKCNLQVLDSGESSKNAVYTVMDEMVNKPRPHGLIYPGNSSVKNSLTCLKPL